MVVMGMGCRRGWAEAAALVGRGMRIVGGVAVGRAAVGWILGRWAVGVSACEEGAALCKVRLL